MGCRGGELSGEEVDILTGNKAICEHLRKNWKHYTDWADRAVSFGVDNEGDKIQVKDLLRIIESAIASTSPKTGLRAAIQSSTINDKQFISIIARATFYSPQECPESIKKLLRKCTGD